MLIAFNLETELNVILESNRIWRICTTNKKFFDTLKNSVNFYLLFFFLFESQYASSGSTAAIFRPFAGYILSGCFISVMTSFVSSAMK